jgi:hypothetical protein
MEAAKLKRATLRIRFLLWAASLFFVAGCSSTLA